ncbi:pimelyl-[acyl-carrier protein] methyl ester esterase [Delftia tsuruhatensis]|uniref:alpha/beta fold hydrolase n=1 Tax=Delftia tsuruhatensis TaxID=180282 RepID=UPI001E7AC254|nr:alpha/beta hydrolase [Delftia tsuruhatensis]CAB5721906.1 pimelyl-[acyl-carrier protein] methyl ester esterase [Delftia tsuruhatensis]CAC9681885.1 pimelyl-[acyl-carrier protein] methyl ester esterase [Delftia tsuruhatensis]
MTEASCGGGQNLPWLAVLPGLDGTGLLLAEFVQVLSGFFRVQVITYPPDEVLSYDELLDHALARLPAGPLFLIGESFSGPLALRLAAEHPTRVRGVILGASFARLDLPLKALLSSLSGLLAWVPAARAPMWLLDGVLSNGHATASGRVLLKQALQMVAPEVLAGRVRQALEVDLLAQGVRVRQPLLYLQACHDRLMPANAAGLVASISGNARVESIAAPHFIFQVRPQACMKAIVAFHECCGTTDAPP